MNDFYIKKNISGSSDLVKYLGHKLLIDGEAGKIEVCTHVSDAFSDIMQNNKANINIDILIMCHPHPLFQGSMDNKVVTSCVSGFVNAVDNACDNDLNRAPLAVRFNYRGVGKSEGKYADAIGETDDLISAYNWVISCFETDNITPNIYLGGFSFGGYVAYSAKDKIQLKHLFLVAPAVREEFDFSRFPEPDVPVSIIMGDADEVIPPDNILNWVRSLSCSYNLIKLKGVSHFFHHNLRPLKAAIKSIYLMQI